MSTIWLYHKWTRELKRIPDWLKLPVEDLAWELGVKACDLEEFKQFLEKVRGRHGV